MTHGMGAGVAPAEKEQRVPPSIREPITTICRTNKAIVEFNWKKVWFSLLNFVNVLFPYDPSLNVK